MAFCRPRILPGILVLCLLPARSLSAEPATTTAAALPASEPAPIDVRDFGARGDGVADDAPAINHAISIAISRPGAVVFIPGGRYRLEVPPGRSDHLSIHRAQGLTIRGEVGTVLVAHDPEAHIIDLYRCRNVKLSMLTLEQEMAQFTQGTIEAVGLGMNTCDVAIDPGYAEPDSPNLATVRSFRVIGKFRRPAQQGGAHFSADQIAAAPWRAQLAADV